MGVFGRESPLTVGSTWPWPINPSLLTIGSYEPLITAFKKKINILKHFAPYRLKYLTKNVIISTGTFSGSGLFIVMANLPDYLNNSQ